MRRITVGEALKAAVTAAALSGLMLTGCAATSAGARTATHDPADDPKVQALAATCTRGCSCDKSCELEFLTCAASAGACTTERAICRQNCDSPLQASLQN